MKSLTRKEFARRLGHKLNIAHADCRLLLDAVFAEMEKAFIAGQAVELRRFGTFSVYLRKPRRGRNPRNPAAGEIKIPAQKVVKFKPTLALRQKMNP